MIDKELLPRTTTLNLLIKENSDIITQLVVTGYLSNDQVYRSIIAGWIDLLHVQSINAVTYSSMTQQSHTSQSLPEL